MSSSRHHLVRIFDAAWKAALPDRCIAPLVSADGHRLQIADRYFDVAALGSIQLIAIGKAADAMLGAFLTQSQLMCLGALSINGIVATKVGHACLPGAWREAFPIHEAEHPTPGAGSIAAAHAVIKCLESPVKGPNLSIFLLSGGGSSILSAPVPGISLSDLKATSKLLVNSGLPIQDMNVVRKHISLVKGGRLLQHHQRGITAAAPSAEATILSFVISDVVGTQSSIRTES